MAMLNNRNDWMRFALRTMAAIIMALMMFFIGRISVAQDRMDNRIGQVEIITAVDSAAIERMQQQLDRMEIKIDRLLEGL